MTSLAMQNQHFSRLFLVSYQRREAIQGCITQGPESLRRLAGLIP
jgi:hypothetical protein